MSFLIGLDIGTTSVKSVVLDAQSGRVVDISSRETPVEHPQQNWSQHDPERLWQVIAGCLRSVRGRGEVLGLGVSSLADSGLPLDAGMQPLYPMIAWYDRRSESQAAWWEQQLSEADLHAITGQRVSTSFGVTKLMWIREHFPQEMARFSHWLSVPDYVLYRLTGEVATDYSIASRTLLFDQGRLTWSPNLLNLAHLEEKNLPVVRPGTTIVGQVTRKAAEETGLPVGLPCVLGGQDHLCGLLAAGAYQPGRVVDSTGTAQAILMLTQKFISSPQIARQTFACYGHTLPGYYVFKGGLKAAGGGLEWLVRQLSGMNSNGKLPYAELEAAARQGVGRKAGPLWLPHLNGAGSPEADRRSRAALVGALQEHEAGDIFRGFLEALAFALRNNIELMQHYTHQPVDEVTLIGGGVRFGLLTELKADVLNKPVAVPEVPEASAVGAALLAGLGSWVYASPEEAFKVLRYHRKMVLPDARRAAWYDRYFKEVYQPLFSALLETNVALERLNKGG